MSTVIMRSVKFKFLKMFNWTMKAATFWLLNATNAILKAIELSTSLTIYMFLSFSEFKTAKAFYAKMFMIKIIRWYELEIEIQQKNCWFSVRNNSETGSQLGLAPNRFWVEHEHIDYESFKRSEALGKNLFQTLYV